MIFGTRDLLFAVAGDVRVTLSGKQEVVHPFIIISIFGDGAEWRFTYINICIHT